MTDFGKRLALLLGLILLLLGSAFFIPSVIASTEDPEIVTLHQEENIPHTVKSPLESTITNIDGSSNIDIVLYNVDTRDSLRISNLGEGNNTTVTISGENVTIYYEEMVTKSNIVISYEIPVYFNWPDGSKEIFNQIGFIMVFTILFFVIGIILVLIGVYK